MSSSKLAMATGQDHGELHSEGLRFQCDVAFAFVAVSQTIGVDEMFGCPVGNA